MPFLLEVLRYFFATASEYPEVEEVAVNLLEQLLFILMLASDVYRSVFLPVALYLGISGLLEYGKKKVADTGCSCHCFAFTLLILVGIVSRINFD